MDNHIFRTALSGFNRQDVMEYIEKAQKEAGETITGLEEQVAQLRQSETQLRQSLETCTGERDELEQRLADMTQRYDEAKSCWDAETEAGAALRSDVAQRDQAVRELTVENQNLLRRVEELEAQANAARWEKEKIAQLELEARGRAAEALEAAQEQAGAINTQAEEQAAAVVREAQAQADAVLSGAQTQADAAIGEAEERAQAMLSEAAERAEAILSEAQTQAQMLRQQTAEHVSETAGQCGELISSFDSIAGHVAGELRRMDVTVSQLPISFNHLRDSLQELLEQVKEEQ